MHNISSDSMNLMALAELDLESVSGGGSDDDGDDYASIGDTFRNGHGFDMVVPDASAPEGMSLIDIGST